MAGGCASTRRAFAQSLIKLRRAKVCGPSLPPGGVTHQPDDCSGLETLLQIVGRGFVSLVAAQFCLNERVDVSIHYGLYVAGLGACSVILHHLIRLKHVGTNLISPGDFAFLAILPLDLSALLVLFKLIKFCFQHFHSQLAISSLAPLRLARHHYSGRLVQNTYGSLNLVDVLSAFAAAAKGVDFE